MSLPRPFAQSLLLGHLENLKQITLSIFRDFDGK
jgi:hypothetical protein